MDKRKIRIIIEIILRLGAVLLFWLFGIALSLSVIGAMVYVVAKIVKSVFGL